MKLSEQTWPAVSIFLESRQLTPEFLGMAAKKKKHAKGISRNCSLQFHTKIIVNRIEELHSTTRHDCDIGQVSITGTKYPLLGLNCIGILQHRAPFLGDILNAHFTVCKPLITETE